MIGVLLVSLDKNNMWHYIFLFHIIFHINLGSLIISTEVFQLAVKCA